MITGAFYAGKALWEKQPWSVVGVEAIAGMHWLIWAVILVVMTRYAGSERPPTEDSKLSPKRKAFAYFMLVLFVLLFMPSWLRGY